MAGRGQAQKITSLGDIYPGARRVKGDKDRIANWLEQESPVACRPDQPADTLLGLYEVINIFEPIYTDREISHRKSNFLASLEKLKTLALWGPHSYLIMVVLRHGCLLG